MSKARTVRTPKGPDSGSSRVYCGGSWFYTPASARCADRGNDTPDYRYSHLGFRLARPVE